MWGCWVLRSTCGYAVKVGLQLEHGHALLLGMSVPAQGALVGIAVGAEARCKLHTPHDSALPAHSSNPSAEIVPVPRQRQAEILSSEEWHSSVAGSDLLA